jgi:site-specific DNA recombinase
MTTSPLRAAIYARYSTDKQRPESLEDQYHECELTAKREGFTVVAKFGDKELSGGTAQRPGYQQMLDAARAGKFDILICEDLSRLWRSRAEYGPRSAELEDLKINMVTATGDDTRRDGWGLLITIKLAMAEHARREASYRTRRGRAGKARAKEPTGGKAYGYICAEQKRTIDPEQAKVVLQIYQWRAAGWSAQRIARELNARRIPSPGSTWNRTSSGPTRKTTKGWRPSAIAGDHTRGVGILNNPQYKGEVRFGRSKWTRTAKDSAIRTVEKVDPSEWIVYQMPSLQIVPTELWDRVHAIQTANNPRREAVKRGIIKGRNGVVKRVGGRDSRYWLGTLLVCTCGANYIGDGLRDYVCPAHTSNSCDNDMRFRRADAHTALFDLLRKEMLNAQGIRTAEAFIKQQLLDQVRQEERAARDAASGADTKRLDQELRELRKMRLRPAAMAAAVEEIERERAELLAKAVGRQDKRQSRAKAMLARLPEIVTEYRHQISEAIKVLTDERVVDDAREATRRLLADGRIVLAPTPTRTAVTGPVQLVGLGAHVLQLAGWQRQARAAGACKLSGSGGRI